MTSRSESNQSAFFVPSILPWIVAAVMLGVYLLTLNPYVGPGSLTQLVNASPYNWRPILVGPVTFLVNYPLRWLPISAHLTALNGLTAVLAALILALLARSVAILPHDRTHEQRQREASESAVLTIRSAWLPPVLAAAACGLQLTFWENATEATGEIINLLLFAASIWCLLEFRLRQDDRWIHLFGLVNGLNLANDWGVLGLLPGFMVAVVWLKGLAFFNVRFLTRTFACWLAGLSLILLLPFVASHSRDVQIGFWQILHFVVSTYKSNLRSLPRDMVLLLSLTSVLPVLVISIKWSSFFGDTSQIGIFVATAMFHFVHALFLFACLWVALDSQFSPRHLGPGYPFLTLYYLGALSIGYFSGYFLLVFGAPVLRSRHDPHPFLQFINRVVTLSVWIILVAAPALLVYRSLPNIQTRNAPLLNHYLATIEQQLPAGGAVVLTDDPVRASFLEAHLAKQARDKSFLVITTGLLNQPLYFHQLEKQHPEFNLTRIFTNQPAALASPFEQIALLRGLGREHEIYYLEPSFGYYFEEFCLEPHGLVYKMQPCDDVLAVVPPTPAQVLENETFWKNLASRDFPAIARGVRQPEQPPSPNLLQRFMISAHLRGEPNGIAQALGTYYARPLDYWGVQMQIAGDYPGAAKWFAQALELKPDNIAAQINLEFNKSLQAGARPVIMGGRAIEERFGTHRKWDQLLRDDGPFDEPSFCYQLGLIFSLNPSYYRQAIREFNRVQDLAPGQTDAPQLICQELIRAGRLGAAIKRAEEIKRTASDADMVNARSFVCQLYLYSRQYSNALDESEQILKLAPDDTDGLFFKSAALIQMHDFSNAVPPLNHLIELQTNNFAAHLNRAIALYQSGHLDAAKQDYLEVTNSLTNSYQVFYGLAQIADKQTNPPEAILYYRKYLKNAPTNTAEYRGVEARLKELEPKKAAGAN